MSADDDILLDFLTEAGELLEHLNSELVELEQRPDDAELLNAAFRAFHTIKGGAGFVGLDPLVRVCHHAEDVFNLLRNGELRVDAGIMDLLLQTLDVVNGQFEDARANRTPRAAPEALVSGLAAIAAGERPASAPSAPAARAPEPPPADPAEAALEALLADTGAQPRDGAASDTIDDDEFEALLDELHGKGGAPSGASSPASTPAGSDTIDDDEFEALLDELHGKGSAPGAAVGAPAAPAPTQARAPAPAPASAPAPAAPARASAASLPQAEDTVRVDVRRLDEIMNLVGELVLARNRLTSRQQSIHDAELGRIAANLDRVTADIQTAVMASRLQPVKRVFSRFPRLVRDLARDLGKQVKLEMHGVETELDKNLVDALAEPLVHLVRNAVDHGIELPEVRESAGKPREGTVVLEALHAGDHVVVSVSEDGAGMDPEKLRRRAVEKGLVSVDQATRLSEPEAYQLIFEPGFSTRDAISDVSGRGVGMDAVKTKIGQLNGALDIESQLGTGTRFSLRLPLTLAILPTLMVVVAGQRFALPLSNVIETYELDRSRLRMIDDQPVLMVRKDPLPLQLGRECLGFGGESETPHVVAVMVENRRIGFVVDELIGQEEVV
ncbi:MAG: chemotaxis protein CheA, partial [Pseudomonadales bacterium]|nr:chemotaxis protein CheA [Pseudomonadales bacterium]